MGVAIKSGCGNVKGSGIRSPPPRAHIVSQIVLKKRLSVKKIAFLSQTLQKFINSLFIFEKKCISGLWPLMAFFKGLRFAQASKKKPFEPRKMLFLSYEKCIYCFWSVFYKKNTIIEEVIS